MSESAARRERDDGLQAAIDAVGITKIATGLGIRTQAVSQWTRVPPARVLDVARISGVPKEQIRPDIYPTEIADSEAAA